MTDLNLAPPESRSPLPALLIAVAILAAIAAAVFYFNPHDTAALTLSNTHVVPTRTNFKTDSIVVAPTPVGQDDLYILTDLRIEDHLRLPITIDTVSADLTTADGQQSVTYAVNQPDIPTVFRAFPQLKPLQAAPLLRETPIQPGQSASGQLIFHFPITKAVWDARKSATITVELYHQTPQTIAFPRP